jgi:hypothetical protein
MTPEQKWALCCKQARRIVRNHRKQIPSGHDYFLSWVVAGVTVATAVAGGVKSHNDAKDAAGQAEAQRKAGLKNKLPAFEPPPLPGYVPFNFNGVQKDAVQADKDYYARSDADFLRRHPSLVQAERIFEDRTLKDQKGDSELLPAIQNELMRAGLEGSLNAFGSTGANLEPGSAGEANVARTLGVGVLNMQDRNRQNRERSLSISEELFPRREIGMSGEDLALSALSDTTNRNAFNASNYAAEAGAYEKNYEINAENQNAATKSNNEAAAAKAAADAERSKALMAAISTGVSAVGTGYGKSSAAASTGPNYTYQSDGTYRPTKAKYPGSSAWVPVGKYAG